MRLLPLQALRKDDGGGDGGDASGGTGPTQSAVHVDTVMGSPGAKRQGKKPRKKKTLLDYVPIPGVPPYGSVRKGEGPGHPFRGNQYTGGIGGTVHESPAVENMNDAGLLHHLAHHHPNVPLSERYPGSNDIVEHSRIHHVVAHTEDHRTPGHDQHIHRDPYPTHQPLLNWLGRHPELMDLAQQSLDPAGGEAVFSGLQNWGIPPLAAAALAELEDDGFSAFQTGPKKLLSDARGLGHFLRGLVKKGEGPGHAFRGNQYTGGMGGFQQVVGDGNGPAEPSAATYNTAKQSLQQLRSQYPEVANRMYMSWQRGEGWMGRTRDNARNTEDTIQRMSVIYPINDPQLVSLRQQLIDQRNSDDRIELQLNLNDLARGAHVQASFNKGQREGFFPPGKMDVTQFTVNHEFAHAIVGALDHDVRDTLFQQVGSALNKAEYSPDGIPHDYRYGYGGVSLDEGIANAFAEYKLVSDARPISKQIGALVDAAYKMRYGKSR